MKRLYPLLAVFLAACSNEPPPPIAADLDLNVSNSERWPARLSERFPPGTAENDLVAALRAQGFEIDAAKKTARLEWWDGARGHSLDATWRTIETGRIAAIDGSHWPACL